MVSLASVLLLLAQAGGGAQPQPAALRSLNELPTFVGTYPCTNGLLEDPVFLQGVRSTLGPDASAYEEHIDFSGCGAIEDRGEFLLMDVSQLHVGGYSSLILLRKSDAAMFVFWLKERVSDKLWQIYGKRPLPSFVMQTVVSEMNQGWGHVARFSGAGESLEIDLLK